MGKNIKVYGFKESFPVRAVFLVAKAINLDYELIPLNVAEGEHLKPEFLKINPQHTIPTIDDNGFVLWDSHAIAAYLVSKYAPNDSLYPKDLQKRAIVDRLLHFESGMLFPRTANIIFPIRYRSEKKISQEKQDAIHESFGFLEKFLEGNQWLAGNQLTIADLCTIPIITTLSGIVNIDQGKYPNLTKWIENCKKLPYFNECNEPGNNTLVSCLKARMSA